MAERRSTSRVIVVWCFILFFILGINVVMYVRQSQHEVATNTNRRKALELSNCIASNVRSLAIRTAIKDSLVALVPPGAVLTEAQQAQVAAYNATVDAQLPYRDCSPDAITFYIEHPPADPAAVNQEEFPTQSSP